MARVKCLEERHEKGMEGLLTLVILVICSIFAKILHLSNHELEEFGDLVCIRNEVIGTPVQDAVA